MDRFLVISDLQIPFQHPKAFEFCRYVKRHFGVLDDGCLCVGDELDEYFGSLFDKDPDADHTPREEIQESIAELHRWYVEFPRMKLAYSNHGMRWLKKAKKAGIPSMLMRDYAEIIQAPAGWRWQDRWMIEGDRQNFIMCHGMEYGGMYAARNATLAEGESIVFGHLHSFASVAHVKTKSRDTWGMCVGSLIDNDAYAFHYGKYMRWRPTNGVGVILDGGKIPIWLPVE